MPESAVLPPVLVASVDSPRHTLAHNGLVETKPEPMAKSAVADLMEVDRAMHEEVVLLAQAVPGDDNAVVPAAPALKDIPPAGGGARPEERVAATGAELHHPDQDEIKPDADRLAVADENKNKKIGSVKVGRNGSLHK